MRKDRLNRIYGAMAALLLLALTASAQVTGPARTVRNGTSNPTACLPGSNNIFFRTDTGNLQVCTASGVWSVIGGGAGTGTVTNTGTLTAGTFVIGNGGVDVKKSAIVSEALGSLVAQSVGTVSLGDVSGAGNSTTLVVDDTTHSTRNVGTFDSSGALYVAGIEIVDSAGGGTTLAFAGAGNAASFENNLTVKGLLKAGSTPVTLTDAAGKILSASLNTVAVANGGTGITSFGTGVATWLGTPSSANFLSAITDETGSGLVMGNNTPTIITPSLTTGFTIAGAATSRKIIVGNGTNFVASTETYAVPGTSGNVLTSDGTNWTSAAPAGGGITIGTTTITSGTNTKVLFNNSGVVGEYTITGTGNVALSASPTFTGTVAGAAFTASGTITQTSASATAFSSGPNGATNPVFQLVNSTASAATGVSVTGNAAGAGATIKALSSAGTEFLAILPKGNQDVLIGDNTSRNITMNADLGTGTVKLQLEDVTYFSLDGSVGLLAGTTLGITSGNLIFNTAGKGLQLKSGTGARAGTLTLVGGTATVTNTTVGANTIILLTRKTSGGTIGTAITYTISNGTSFTVNSDNILDTSTFVYHCIEVN